FVASGAQTVTHSLILTGTAGNALSLRSTSSPAQWKLNAPSTQSLSFLNVKDSDASGGQLVTPANSIDSGNNINWNFNAVFPPTKLAITAIAPTTPTAGSSFDVTVQSQDGAGGPANIAANTGFTLSNTGGGLIGGATSGT